MRSYSDEGLGLAVAVDTAVEQPVGELSIYQLQTHLTALCSQTERLNGRISQAVGELHSRSGGQVPAHSGGPGRTAASICSSTAWLRDATTLGGPAAGALIRTATALRELPELAQAVTDGQLGNGQAAALTRLVGKLPASELLEAQPSLLAIAAHRDPQSVASLVSHLLATYSEPHLQAADTAGRARRYLQLITDPDGTVRGRFTLAGEDAEALHTIVAALARRRGLSDQRSAAQRRADALTEACEIALRHGQLPEHGGQRPHLSYVLPAGWAAHQPPPPLPALLADELGQPSQPAQPGQPGQPGRYPPLPVSAYCATGAWSGPQTRPRIEAMLCDARLSRVLLDSTGQVRALHTLTDTITTNQRRALAARDHGCTTRGCTRPPAHCDAHHLTSLADNGPTTLNNLALLCRHHHLQWHRGALHPNDLHTPWLTTAPGPPTPPTPPPKE